MALNDAWIFLKSQKISSGSSPSRLPHQNLADILGVHPNSVQLALDRLEAGGKPDEEDSDDFMTHVMDGEADTICYDCGWGGKGHESQRDHPSEDGRCPKCNPGKDSDNTISSLQDRMGAHDEGQS